jgi:hypothetical protein
MRSRRLLPPLVPMLLALAIALLAPGAAAAPVADDGNAEWQVEQPAPPPPEEAGVEPSSTPVSLGHIGDIQFWAPNRGALITSGNGSTVKPGVWFYDGVRWRELSNQCGATDGRIAWAGPDEFWTISDERAGQAVASGTERPPLEDNTLCHFAPPSPGAPLQIVGSYASPPFQGSSYQAMHAAGCLTPGSCWFAGDPLPAPQVGAFQLHWNGQGVEPQPYLPEGHPIWDMQPFAGRLVESTKLNSADHVAKQVPRPPPLRRIKPTSNPEESPFESVTSLPLYSAGESSFALDYLHLSVNGESIWAAGGPQLPTPAGSREAGVTIIRKAGEGAWSRVIAPQATGENEAEPPPGAKLFPGQVLNSIAGEPGASSAWIGLDSFEDAISPSRLARASLARVSSEGAVSDRLELPAAGDPHGPLGAAQRVVCPAEHDCWATTADGWLLHLATSAEREHPNLLADPVFASIENEEPITFRPHDAGLPQEPSDEVPADTSGEEQQKRLEEVIKPNGREQVATVTVPLLSHVRSHVIHGTTLELTFRLAVKARVRLLAERRHKVVAKTRQLTLNAGNRKIDLKLDARHWPTKLNLQTHALAALPTQTTRSPNVNSVSTSFVAPARLLSTGLIP